MAHQSALPQRLGLAFTLVVDHGGQKVRHLMFNVSIEVGSFPYFAGNVLLS
jgi:hypothetical protein